MFCVFHHKMRIGVELTTRTISTSWFWSPENCCKLALPTFPNLSQTCRAFHKGMLSCYLIVRCILIGPRSLLTVRVIFKPVCMASWFAVLCSFFFFSYCGCSNFGSCFTPQASHFFHNEMNHHRDIVTRLLLLYHHFVNALMRLLLSILHCTYALCIYRWELKFGCYGMTGWQKIWTAKCIFSSA